jgi:hypothetical protein
MLAFSFSVQRQRRRRSSSKKEAFLPLWDNLFLPQLSAAQSIAPVLMACKKEIRTS